MNNDKGHETLTGAAVMQAFTNCLICANHKPCTTRNWVITTDKDGVTCDNFKPPKGIKGIKVTEKTCGTCKWHEHENISDGWVCVNSDSDYCADWTKYTDTCGEWKRRL